MKKIEISVEHISIICIGVVIAVLLLLIVLILVVRFSGSGFSTSHLPDLPAKEFFRRVSTSSDENSASEDSKSIYFTPPECHNSANESKVIIITDDDISNYTNRYDVFLLKGFGETQQSVSMCDLSTKKPKTRSPRRSLPTNYIDV